MAKISDETVTRWTDEAQAFLQPHGLGVDAVLTGRDAWAIAHSVGICREAYKDRDIVDAHIQTALQKVFPNAVFQDAKRY